MTVTEFTHAFSPQLLQAPHASIDKLGFVHVRHSVSRGPEQVLHDVSHCEQLVASGLT